MKRIFLKEFSASDFLENQEKFVSFVKEERLCFMCNSPIPSKKSFGKTNAFRTVACDNCYNEQYNKNFITGKRRKRNGKK